MLGLLNVCLYAINGNFFKKGEKEGRKEKELLLSASVNLGSEHLLKIVRISLIFPFQVVFPPSKRNALMREVAATLERVGQLGFVGFHVSLLCSNSSIPRHRPTQSVNPQTSEAPASSLS